MPTSWSALKPGHRPTDEYVHALRQNLPREFPGVSFYFLPADIISQILNFGLPAPIDIQVSGPNIDANHAFATKLLGQLRNVSGRGRSAHSPAVRSAPDSNRRGPHQGPAERLHAVQCRQQYAGLLERQLPDRSLVLARSAETA